jgi:hypothetical protein
MSHRGSDPRDPLERQKVKVAHTQRTRGEREGGRLDVGVGMQGAMYVYRSTTRTGTARRDSEVFGIGRTPPETMRALGKRSPTERRFAAM